MEIAHNLSSSIQSQLDRIITKRLYNLFSWADVSLTQSMSFYLLSLPNTISVACSILFLDFFLKCIVSE